MLSLLSRWLAPSSVSSVQSKTVQEATDRELFIWYVSQYIGRWYKWGGDDPSGFDCSGISIEGLKAVGRVPRGGWDTTAQGLFDYKEFKKISTPTSGALVFYGITDVVFHVEVCLNDRFAIGASGGGSNCRTEADAIRLNAFIKMRPIVRGRDIAGYRDPF